MYSVSKLYRKQLRQFRCLVENHRTVRKNAKIDNLECNIRASCLLSHFMHSLGRDITYGEDELPLSVGDEFMLGADIQFLFRYSLSIHLNSLKDKG